MVVVVTIRYFALDITSVYINDNNSEGYYLYINRYILLLGSDGMTGLAVVVVIAAVVVVVVSVRYLD